MGKGRFWEKDLPSPSTLTKPKFADLRGGDAYVDGYGKPKIIYPSAQSTLPSNNPIPPAPSVEEEPEVIIQTVPRPAPPVSADPVSGSEVPDISSSNPSNFYTMYSKVQYNVVA